VIVKCYEGAVRTLGTLVFPGAVVGLLALAAGACGSKSSAPAAAGDGSVGRQCDSLGASFCAQEAAQCVFPEPDGGVGGGSEGGTDGGTDGGPDGAPAGGPVTMLSVCDAIGKAFCQREAACSSTATTAMCESGFLSSCCGSDGTCGDGVLGSPSTLQACIAAIGQDGCADILAENLPAQCSAVIAPWTGVAGCESQWHDACCGQSGLCSSTSKTPQSSIDGCDQALSTRMCGAAAPPACTGVISTAAAEGVEPVVEGNPASRAATRFAARVRATAASFVAR
jgi:hypothetical protein